MSNDGVAPVKGRLTDTQQRVSVVNHGTAVGVASAIWAISIFLSRVMGLVREQIIGRTLGATRQADLYFASFTLPDFLNYLLAAGALSIVFIPIFLEHLERGDDKGGWQAFSVIANFILLIGSAGIVLLMAFARPLTIAIAPGFKDPAEIDTLVRLIRIILPAQFFHIVGGLLSAALQAQDRHLLPALAPLVYSAGIIAGGLVGGQLGMGADGFAWGVLIGSILGPFGLPLLGCLRSGMHWFPLLSLRDKHLKRYLWLSLPIMLGFSIVVVDEWIIKNQASYLAGGTLSHLQYARTLMKVPVGMFGMAIGVASYPTLSRMIASGGVADAYAMLCRALRLMLTLTFAAQICLTLAGSEAAYLIWGVFGSRFGVADAKATGTMLVFLCLGLGGWAAQTIIARGFYALGSTWQPTIIGTIVTICVLPLYVVLRQHMGGIGLAVASSTSILVYVVLIGWLQHRRFEREIALQGTSLDDRHRVIGTSLRLGLSAIIAIGAGLSLRPLLMQALPRFDLASAVLRAASLCTLGLILYTALARILGVGAVSDVWNLLARRVKLRTY